LALKDNDVQYHLVINSDVYFEPNVLDKIADYMDKNPDVAQVQPYVSYPDGSQQETVRLLPTPIDLIFRRFLPKSLAERLNYRYTLLFWDHKTPLNIAYHQGSFMFFRLSALEKVGLFDERFFLYPEDIDITRRMHKCFRTMFWPSVSIVHAHRAASYKNSKMLLIHMWNMVKYFNKWGWFFDRERKAWNNEVLRELNYKGFRK
jgi:GT2 family glycosyltransferase